MIEQSRESVKKALFILDYPLSEWKGTQRTIYEFANYLYQMGYGVTLLENSKETQYSLDAKLPIPFKIISSPFRRFKKTKIIRNAVRTEKPDVIYSANIIDPFIPTFGVKTIFGMHVLNVSAIPYMRLNEKIKFFFVQVSLSIFSFAFWKRGRVMFHADNYDQLNWVKRIYFGRYRVDFVGLPVECTGGNDLNPIKQKTKNDRFTILFFGALDKGRGFETYYKMILALKDDPIFDSLQFVIAGIGKMADIAEEAQHHFHNVRYVPKPSEDLKREVMITSDLFIFPSFIENYSIGTVEAQLNGLPALVLDTASFRNIIVEGKTGFCITGPDLIGQLVQKIKYYYNIWSSDYDSYQKMRSDIAELTKRLCKEKVLPDFHKMIIEFLKER